MRIVFGDGVNKEYEVVDVVVEAVHPKRLWLSQPYKRKCDDNSNSAMIDHKSNIHLPDNPWLWWS